MEQERLAKVISRAGVCSRREAERLIIAGEVFVNDSCIKECATFVTSKDIISVAGKVIQSSGVEPKLWIYHKPKGIITTHSDPQGRVTVFEAVKDIGERVISVGRLDYNTEGLLLLTNYGPWARYLEHPKNKLKRVYKVRVFGHIVEENLDKLRKPFTFKHIRYQPFNIKRLDHKWLEVTIYEGKNREIRNAMESIGLKVARLIRIIYGEYKLGVLKPGEHQEVQADGMKNIT